MRSSQLTTGLAHSENKRAPDLAAPLPFVSVIVPCRNEEKRIARCLDSILASDYPTERIEILILDGMSEDRTREIVKGYAERWKSLRLLDNPEKNIPAAMNLGIRNARGETVIKMDAHSTYQNNHIRQCVEYQDKYAAANVGGVCNILAGSNTAVGRAIALGMAHRFGSGNARIKVGASKPTWSDSTAFGCFKKDLFIRIGLFDERLLGSSDMDMNARIRAAGGRILVAPEIVIDYHADADLKSLWRHNFADGVWTTYVIKFGSRASSWRHWVPLFLVLSLLGSFALAPLSPFLLWLGLATAGVYAATSLTVSLQIAIREKHPIQLLLLPGVFAVRHFAWGVGALFGLVLVALPGARWKGRRRMRG